MLRFLYYLAGILRVKLTAVPVDTFLNETDRKNIPLLRFVISERDTAVCEIPLRCRKRFEKIVSATGAIVEEKRILGVWPRVKPFLHRKALLAGLVLALLVVWGSSLFLFQVRVEGNQTVPTSRILSALYEENVKPGRFRLSVDCRETSEKICSKIPGISSVSINFRGYIADVSVREEKKMPEIFSRDDPGVVVASRDGIVTALTVLNGKALCKAGDSVKKGDVLVTGRMESEGSPVRFVRSMAEVKAVTHHTVTGVVETEGWKTEEEKSEKTEYALIAGQNKLDFHFHTGNCDESCDKIIKRDDVNLFGTALPIQWEKISVRKGMHVPAFADLTQMEEILKQHLLHELEEHGGRDLEIRTLRSESHSENGILTVTLEAECLENIAEDRAMTAAEMMEKQKRE